MIDDSAAYSRNVASSVPKYAQDRLNEIKKNIREAYMYWRENTETFRTFNKLVFKTTLDSEDIAVLTETQKPMVEFNILEAYVSRARGEFSKHEPSIDVKSNAGAKVEPEVIDVVDGHLKYIIDKCNNDDGLEYDVYTDTLAGGFSVIKVMTDYASETSFDHVITINRVFDPTLCGFDPMATKSHKGDGRFCFEITPMSEQSAIENGLDPSKFNYTRDIEGFSWSYMDGTEKVIVAATYFEKKKKKKKILWLTDGQIMTRKEYKLFLRDWELEGKVEQPPQIRDERTTTIETICQYMLNETAITQYKETDYKYFPLIFVDGNSRMIREQIGGPVRQVTRPLVYNARGIQKLKNFAGQCLANELENTIQHKWMAPKEGIPEKYIDAYMNVQKANTLVYNAYNNDNPDQPLPPPQAIARTPIPPEITNTFQISDELTQVILGNFDASISKLPDNQVSGLAIQESMSLSNQTTMPYIVSFMRGWTRVAEVIVDLIPKYYATPRSIPMYDKEGKEQYIKLGEDVNLNYDSSVLQVTVKAGLNFSIQKARALNEVIQLTQASPAFAQFMAAEGLEIILDNIDIRGADKLKASAMEFMEKVKQQQQMAEQQAQQQSQQPNPAMIKAQNDQMKMQLEQQKMQMEQNKFQAEMQMKIQEMQLKMAAMKQEEERMKNERLEMLAKLKMSDRETDVDVLRAKVEHESTQANIQIARERLELEKERHQYDKSSAQSQLTSNPC